MLQCSKDTIIRLFYDLSSSFFLLFIVFHFTSLLLAKLFIFLGGSPFYQRNQEGYDVFSDEEMEEGNECYRAKSMDCNTNLLANIIPRDESSIGNDSDEVLDEEFSEDNRSELSENNGSEQSEANENELSEENESEISEENGSELSEENGSEETCYSTPVTELSYEELLVEERILAKDSDSNYESDEIKCDPNPKINTISHEGEDEIQVLENQPKLETDIRKEEDFLVFQLHKAQGKKLVQERDEYETSRDNFTIGSTSKDSSEWRSSTFCRDSVTEDPFSSSSRRSCPNWESCTVFQKYDEEMLFLDRISVQKLQETESLRSIQVCPRSISERIVFSLKTRKPSEYRNNPYHELESAYVAQICLTWEALNWNFKYFQRLRASRREFDPGCPAYIAQQFQQFQVLLQRYTENEPYEYGRRPEIYARMRSMAPKLLQVPEYRDTDDDKAEEGHGSRIPSNSFLVIMEESIRTFMNFLKQDKKTHCQILADFFKKRKRGSADATLHLLKKVNKKKKSKLQEIRRHGNCIRKRKLRKEEELEILMALIDLKVVSRVLRMMDLSGEQMHWCENKMSRVRVSDGKLHRDSTPLFFTAN